MLYFFNSNLILQRILMDRPSKSNTSIPKNIKGSMPMSNNVLKNNVTGQHPNSNKCNKFKRKEKAVIDMKSTQQFRNKFKGKVSAFNPKHKGGLALALEEYKTKKIEEQKRKEENKNKKEEMNKALQRYKEKKAQKLKRLCKKTKKGQPIMKYWIEDLLQKIQSTS